MAANSQNNDDPEEGSVNGQESTTKDKKPKGWKHIPKNWGKSKMSDALRRIYETQNQLHKFNYTGKKIKHFEIIVI